MAANRLLERQLRVILDDAPDGVMVESDERVVYLNPAYALLLGYPSTTELFGATIKDIAHPDDLERLRWFGRLRREGKPAPTRYTFRARARSGEVVSFDASISQAKLDGETLITTIVRECPAPSASQGRSRLAGTKALSAREAEVVEQLLRGARSKEIALILNVSEKTIWTHRSRAFRKLAVRGIADLFRLASETDLLPQ